MQLLESDLGELKGVSPTCKFEGKLAALAPRRPSGRNSRTGIRAKWSLDWSLGFLAGTLFGFVVALNLVDPSWLSAESDWRVFASAVGAIGALSVCVLRNGLKSELVNQRERPTELTTAHRATAAEMGH